MEGQETMSLSHSKMDAAKKFSKLTKWAGQHEDESDDEDDDFVKNISNLLCTASSHSYQICSSLDEKYQKSSKDFTHLKFEIII